MTRKKTKKKAKAKKRRNETRATKRLKREVRGLGEALAQVTLSLKKERTKNECYHDTEHRYAVPRKTRYGDTVNVVICGYCGRELSTEHLDDFAAGRAAIEAVAAKRDKPKSGGYMKEHVEDMDRSLRAVDAVDDWWVR
jgi:hypothetical protein